ncbi:TDP-N-acetylfucosamine:lipid II N-acetylfucosaminyltransferase [Candidatus Providencia siddallii]|uniref:TDP-N-acetylfucosamine:lipid II N-acetylfucosaminyltransferase n=1 Tax=Candidatus Providencia siddallii TaxID=1715285 RepID=A0ABP1CG28_9GAMM
MKKLIHVLGSNISHHNNTLLNFFNKLFLKEKFLLKKFLFFVVTKDKNIINIYSNLEIKTFDNKLLLAKNVIKNAINNRYNRFFFHGQFNVFIWLGLLFGGIKSYQFWWHIWGADLYEESNSLKFKIFYIFRRLAYKKVGYVCATRGDLDYYYKINPKTPSFVLYFPTKIDLSLNKKKLKISVTRRLTILLGNSGDSSNRHEEALIAIKKQFGEKVKIIIPMGYPNNNQTYIRKIEKVINQKFKLGEVIVIKEYLSFNKYISLLRTCDLSYLIFNRQQGIGTICLLIQLCIPFVISKENTFLKDLKLQNIPVFIYGNKFTIFSINKIKQQIFNLNNNKINFFPPNFVCNWKIVLSLFAKR